MSNHQQDCVGLRERSFSGEAPGKLSAVHLNNGITRLLNAVVPETPTLKPTHITDIIRRLDLNEAIPELDLGEAAL